eukprot:jgi/Orpsp1_1/1190410/evm.model.d7180000078806.1
MSEFNLPEKEKLQGNENFTIWEVTINNYLKAKKLLKYIEYDCAYHKKSPQKGKKLTEDELNYNEEIEAQDALASTIIFANVSDKIKVYIKDCKSAKDKMIKIRDLYSTDESEFYAKWIKKLYTIKAKNIENTMNIMNEIIELFRLLEKSPMKPTDLEKLTIMYKALPPILKSKVNFTSSLTIKEFYDEIKNKCIIYNYLNDRWSNTNQKYDNQKQYFEQNTNYQNETYDPMDIDNIEGKHNKNNYQFKSNKYSKYCVICNNKGHIAKECYFNPCGTNRNNKRCKFNKNYKNYKNKNSKMNNTKYKKNTVNNIEHKNEDSTPCYEEINAMFGNDISNIEYENTDNNNENNITNESNEPINLCEDDIILDQSEYNHVISKLDDLIGPFVSPAQNKKLLSNLDNKKSRDRILCNIDKKEDFSEWTFDTGASEHITNDKSLLVNFKQQRIIMNCANKSSCIFEGYGMFHGEINGNKITLDKVLYSKDINKNLISGIKLAKNGINSLIKVVNNDTYLTLINNNNKIITSIKCDHFNIARVNIKNSNEFYSINSTESYEFKELWHKRLGHFYQDNLESYLELHNIKKPICLDCQITKLKRLPHNNITPKASKLLEVIHSDIIGPINPTSIDYMKYIITFIDEFSRKSWVFTLKDKKEATKIIIYFIIYINNQYENKIKYFKSDNGKEYNNQKVINYCKKYGIMKVYSPPYNPENNGIAERFNQTLINSAKTLIYWSKLSLDFWSFAVIYSNFLYNITPHKGISNLIPNEIFYNTKINLSKIKVFGCNTYYNNIQYKNSKFDPNSKL